MANVGKRRKMKKKQDQMIELSLIVAITGCNFIGGN
jgi:hypothetical protein